ncbi:MAG: translation initiation factor IF-2 [Alphaproteobacteria bacterium]
MTDQPKKTLSLGGTLSIGGGSGAPRPGAGVAVEVRKRRFDAPNPTNKPTPASGVEVAQRAQALQQSQVAATKPATNLSPREEALRKAAQLQEERAREVSERARVAAEDRAKADEAKAAAAATSTARAGSGAGGVQSGTLANSGAKAAINSRDFTRAPAAKAGTDDRRGAKPTGKPGAKDDGKKRGRNAYMSDLEERFRGTGKRRGRGRPEESTGPAAPAEKMFREVAIPEFITVGELAGRMGEKASDVVKKLMLMGEMVTLNQTIDQTTAELIVADMGHTAKLVQADNIETKLMEADDAAELLITRAPIVTIMGHVDHGKTTLLDSIRKANVVSGEAGGITQHIGAYQVISPSGRPITFLDTPGHAAFTAMRARGAKVTDVVILVVAADDGIMPQTIEAIQHAKAAGVPIVVAINKMDKPGANPQKVKNELLSHDIILEEFGGTVPAVPVSALKGTGLAELEEVVLLQADVLDLKANPNRRADGSVVEAKLDKGRGPVATVIVQRGTLRVGDIVVAGSLWGRVRALLNDKGVAIEEAGPSMPVAILGLHKVPQAGDTFVVAADERTARDVALQREQQDRERAQNARKSTLETLMDRMGSGSAELNVIVKADVQGSVEAITHALTLLNSDQQQVKVKVISGGVGVITETDVNLAGASAAIVVGFNVRADATAREKAAQAGIEFRYYSIIYNLIDDIKAAMSGLLAPSSVEEIVGRVQIRQIFKFDKLKIAGCRVTDGEVKRGSKARILRDGKVVYTGEIDTLRRGKDDVKEVKNGFECGMTFTNYTDFAENDEVEVFTLREVKRTIDDLKAAAAKL